MDCYGVAKLTIQSTQKSQLVFFLLPTFYNYSLILLKKQNKIYQIFVSLDQ